MGPIFFQLRYYKTSENIRAATDVIATKITRGILYGVEKDVIYQLRVLGTSLGGDGKLSPTTYFTLGKFISIICFRHSCN